MSSIGLYLWSTRYLMAWSIDQIAPPQVAKLGTKRNTPVNAILIVSALVLVFGVMLVYVHNFTYVAGGLLQATLLLCTSIAAVVFPFRMRSTYKGTIGWEIGRVPIVTMVGIIATAFMCVMVYQYATNATFGTVTGASLTFSIAVLAVGLAYYAVAWGVAKVRGYDLGLTYREVPPE
jgi:amino acid transporter